LTENSSDKENGWRKPGSRLRKVNDSSIGMQFLLKCYILLEYDENMIFRPDTGIFKLSVCKNREIST
jgi:hypothetical protein